MGSSGLQVHLCCSKAMAGIRFPPSQVAKASTAGAPPTGVQLHTSLAGGSSIVQSRSLFMRSALLGLMAPGMFSGPQPALARSRVSAIPEVRSRFPKFLSSWFPKWFPQPPVSQVLKTVEWPVQFPFKPEDFQRYDESSDKIFYDNPRFVTHIDDYAIKALSQYYASMFPPANTPGVAILDLCSSWISHYPKNYRQGKIVGLGLNGDELRRNEVLTDFVVQDLNVDPKLPFEDNSFDIITNAVSVDYLTKPLEIFKEMNRILKPGGLAAMSFSNRCFFTKAISVWTSTDDADHVWIVGSYFHYAGGYEPPQALDISPNPGRSDPMYVVFSKKASA